MMSSKIIQTVTPFEVLGTNVVISDKHNELHVKYV